MSQEGLVPSVCLKAYEEEGSQPAADSGLGTPAQLHSPGTSGLSSVVEEDEEVMDMDFYEEGEGVGAEDGIVMEGCYMAVAKDFKARRSDEMDVKEGDVVCVLDDSQQGEMGWCMFVPILVCASICMILSHPDIWYVGLEEKEGWLPVSILVPINKKLEGAGDVITAAVCG